MSARLLFMKFSSGISRSRIPLGAHGSASARARAPEGGFMTLGNPLHEAYVRPGMAVPSNRGIHGDDGGIKTLCNLFHGANIHPITALHNKYWIHVNVARYPTIFPSSRAAATTSYLIIGEPSILNCMKSKFVRQKRLFSSNASARRVLSREDKMAAWRARPEAKSAASRAEQAASQAEMAKSAAEFQKFMRNQMLLWSFTAFCWIIGSVSEEHTSICNG